MSYIQFALGLANIVIDIFSTRLLFTLHYRYI